MTAHPSNLKKTNGIDIKFYKDPFAYIAIWQLMAFILLLLLIWVIEFGDLISFYFSEGASPQEFDFYQGWALSAAVLFAAIVTVGNTYIQQRRVVKGLVSICSKCKKVRLDEHNWQKIEAYISERSLFSFSHGLCPECTTEVMKSLNLDDKKDLTIP